MLLRIQNRAVDANDLLRAKHRQRKAPSWRTRSVKPIGQDESRWVLPFRRVVDPAPLAIETVCRKEVKIRFLELQVVFAQHADFDSLRAWNEILVHHGRRERFRNCKVANANQVAERVEESDELVPVPRPCISRILFQALFVNVRSQLVWRTAGKRLNEDLLNFRIAARHLIPLSRVSFVCILIFNINYRFALNDS